MAQQFVRAAAVAGSWYPATESVLRQEVDRYLAGAGEPASGRIQAVIAPHAGLMYSGPVAAWAYRAVRHQPFEAIVLVGPSHYVGFDGVAVCPSGVFETPLGPVRIDEGLADRLLRSSPAIIVLDAAHAREHSLEMQLPFVKHLFPETPIVPLVMGHQSAATIGALARALADAVSGRAVLLVASTDLSHFFDAAEAQRLDGETVDLLRRFDAEGLLHRFESFPEGDRGRYVACGGGPAISVMDAARRLGARDAWILNYAHSGAVSGDLTYVVGYTAAAFGTRTP